MDLSSLFAMGGYGGYIWPAYGLAVVALGLLLTQSLRAARRSEAALADLRGRDTGTPS